MIISIDQSPDWRKPPTSSDWARLLEALFLQCPERRPASRLEVFLLSNALQCPEAALERHRSRRYAPQTYTLTMPACTAYRMTSATLCAPSLAIIRPR